jgi:hypothetical protein
MSMLQIKLNRELPFGTTYHGSGVQSVEDAECRYYQHGLYFNAKDELLVNNPRNTAKISEINALMGRNKDEPVIAVVTPQREPVNPETVAFLEGLSDAEIYEMALRLLTINAEKKIEDAYEPQESDRDENIRFIAKYAS